MMAFLSAAPVRFATPCRPFVTSRTPHVFARRHLRSTTKLLPFACASPPTSSESPSPSPPASRVTAAFVRVTAIITTLFPLWTTLASVIALQWPSVFTSLTSPTFIQTALSILMLSTGLTLSPSDLSSALRKPIPILFSFVACYLIMPLIAVLLSTIFALDPTSRAGLLLLSIISGGQASNLCTYIARGDTALSVTMTATTTLAAALMLPLLSSVFLGTIVHVDKLALALSTARLTLLPIALGATLNSLFPNLIKKITPLLPVIGIASVLVLVLGPVAQSASVFSSAWKPLLLPITLLHLLGGMVGFAGPLLFRGGIKTAITTAFETGFKSPALSFVLATRFFPPGVQLASIVSIVVLAPLAALCAVALRLSSSRSTTRPPPPAPSSE